jgi:soluble lytic murein transglycosylase
LAKLFTQTDHHLAAFHRLNQIVRTLTPVQIRNLPREFWTLLYPKTFWDHIIPHATRHRLSPYLVLSLIRQESAFNPRAFSHAGARGLMQLIPSTARIVARQTRVRRFNLHMLFEPHANIQLGTHYFSSQLQQFDHNSVFALAAYNAGPHRVEQWRQRWSDLPIDEFIEQIPFDETRLYVKLILRNLLVYEYLYHPVPDA